MIAIRIDRRQRWRTTAGRKTTYKQSHALPKNSFMKYATCSPPKNDKLPPNIWTPSKSKISWRSPSTPTRRFKLKMANLISNNAPKKLWRSYSNVTPDLSSRTTPSRRSSLRCSSTWEGPCQRKSRDRFKGSERNSSSSTKLRRGRKDGKKSWRS